MTEQRVFASVWDALEDDPAEAAKLKAMSGLLIAIQESVRSWNVENVAAAERLGISPRRLGDILKGRIDKFSLDDLVRLATRAGLSIKLDVVRPAA